MFYDKYCKDETRNFFHCDSTASPLARPICKRVNQLLEDCEWRIGNGQNIRLNSRLWIPSDRNLDDDVMVNQLLDDSKSWEANKLA